MMTIRMTGGWLPGADLCLMEDNGLAAPAGGGAPASHYGGHRVIVGGGVRQTGGHHCAAEDKRMLSYHINNVVSFL